MPPHSRLVPAFGIECRCLGLDRLIHVKRAVGRPKDFDATTGLETLRDDRGDPNPS